MARQPCSTALGSIPEGWARWRRTAWRRTVDARDSLPCTRLDAFAALVPAERFRRRASAGNGGTRAGTASRPGGRPRCSDAAATGQEAGVCRRRGARVAAAPTAADHRGLNALLAAAAGGVALRSGPARRIGALQSWLGGLAAAAQAPEGGQGIVSRDARRTSMTVSTAEEYAYSIPAYVRESTLDRRWTQI